MYQSARPREGGGDNWILCIAAIINLVSWASFIPLTPSKRTICIFFKTFLKLFLNPQKPGRNHFLTNNSFLAFEGLVT